MVGISRKRYSYVIDKYKVSADVVGKAMEEIEAKEGAVTSKNVLEASRPEDSPTHAIFEWDDSVAAEKYRLSQSSECIRNIRIEIEEVPTQEVQLKLKLSDADDEPQKPNKYTARAFVNTTDSVGTRPGRYESFAKVMSDKDKRFTAINNALREFKWLLNKYDFISEFEPIAESVAQVEAENNKRKE